MKVSSGQKPKLSQQYSIILENNKFRGRVYTLIMLRTIKVKRLDKQ